MTEAVRLYRLSADQNYAGAHYHLGRHLVNNSWLASPTEMKEGALLLARAAHQTEVEEVSRLALQVLSEYAHERDVVHACCIGCGKTQRLRRCSRCHVAKFCGAACARRMWPVHNAGCSLWAADEAAAFAAAPAPDAEAAPVGYTGSTVK